MKKITLLLLVMLSAVSLQAQTVNFKMGYKPNMTYKQTVVQSGTTSISYGADMEPMEQEMGFTMFSTTQTGKLVNGEMKLTTSISAEKGSELLASLPEGTMIYGKAKESGAPQYDSIQSPGMDPKLKEMMIGMMKAQLDNLFIADRTVKVGESFTIQKPTSVPAGPVTLTMENTNTYTLKKVEGRKAFFDIQYEVTMNTQAEGQDIKGTGGGTGQIVYDMDRNFVTEQKSNISMRMAMEVQGMSMTITSKSTNATTTLIVAN